MMRRGIHFGGSRDVGPLFITSKGERLKRQAAGRIVKRIAKRAGVTKNVSPHSFRHGFITIARNAGIPTRDIMSATGHADERMCAYYDRDPNNVARSAVHGVGAYVAGAS
jgi:integrase/recombinase XerD